MRIGLRPATAGDGDYCYRVHRAALGEYVARIWGWDEEVQRGFHGRGFDPDRQPPPDRPGGFGLTAMRSRARELGGSLTIETSPGDGTVVAVRIPEHDEDETGQVPPTSAPPHQEDR